MNINPVTMNSAISGRYRYSQTISQPVASVPQDRDMYIASNYRCNSLEDMIAFDRAKLQFWNRDTGALPKLEEVNKDIIAMDFSGMSKGEIYGAIFDRFADTFGEDFHCMPALSNDDCKVAEAFASFLKEHVYGSKEDLNTEISNDYFKEHVDASKADLNAAYCEWMGYSGSAENIRDTIMQKYNYGKDLTVRGVLQMTGELIDAGLISRLELLTLQEPISQHLLFIDDTNIGDLESILNRKVNSYSYYKGILDLNENFDGSREMLDFIKNFLENFCKVKLDEIAEENDVLA